MTKHNNLSSDSTLKLGTSKTTKKDFRKYNTINIPGVIYGLNFPHSAAQIQSDEYGASWLTKAFHASGAIPSKIQVDKIVNITDISKKVGGGAADKVLIEVRYSDSSYSMTPRKFFIKLPCADMKNKWRAATLNQPGPEVLFSYMFCSPSAQNSDKNRFPVRTPKVYFCDINPISTNFIIIQECIEYSDGKGGPGSVLPAPEKYKDYLLEGGPDPYYTLLIDASAKMCAYYYKNRDTDIGAKIRDSFPKIVIPFPTKLRGLVRFFSYWIGRSLMFFSLNFIKKACPMLCSEEILTKEALAQFQKEYEEILYHFPEIMIYLINKGEEYLVYGHPNMNTDNAFFYRSENNTLDCGVLDFGGYQGTNLLFLLGTSIGCAPDDYLCQNEERLIKMFANSYEKYGGQYINPDSLFQDWKLMPVFNSFFASAISLIVPSKIPWKLLKKVKDRREPLFADNFDARCFTDIVISSFERWRLGKAYEHFNNWKHEHPELIVSRSISWYIFYRPWHFIHEKFMSFIIFLYMLGKK